MEGCGSLGNLQTSLTLMFTTFIMPIAFCYIFFSWQISNSQRSDEDMRVVTSQPVAPTSTIHQSNASHPNTENESNQAEYATLLDIGSDDLLIPALEPELMSSATSVMNLPSETATVPGSRSPVVESERPKKLVPWDGKIKWAIKTSSIFNNWKEELSASSYRPNLISRQHLSDMWIFQYGIRYIPREGDTNSYRTVKIEELPLNTTMDEILPKIRGRIYSARLLNTSQITGYHTAIVIFILQSDALRFLQHASKSGLWVGHTKVKVSLVNTPTYPMSVEQERLIFEEGHTRCVSISNLRESLLVDLYNVLYDSVCHNYMECIEEGYRNDICIRFHSIPMATMAFKLIESNPKFRACRVAFIRDPCSHDVEILEKACE